MPSTNRRNLYILTFTLFVVMLGFGIVIPIIPFYMESFGAGGTELGLLVASYAVMRLIVGPVWGTLSDRVGRKPVLMIGVLGYAITMIWFGLATELWMLFAARILSGVLSSATSPTTMAYIDGNIEARPIYFTLEVPGLETYYNVEQIEPQLFRITTKSQ